MFKLNIYEALNLRENEVISFIGGGGKTTTMFQLASELKSMNRKVLVTTTTAIFDPHRGQYDHYFLKNIGNFAPENGTITVFGDRVENGKLLGTSPLIVEYIARKGLFQFILIEADGSKGKPIKAYADYEPVIPETTTMTIGIIGLDCLGKSIIDISHRPEILADITGTSLNYVIDEEMIVRLILHEKGLFKDSRGRRVLFLNKASYRSLIDRGRNIRNRLAEEGFQGIALVGDIINNKFY